MLKEGNPHGSDAIIDDGPVQSRRIAYNPEPMIERLRKLDLPAHVFDQLAHTFSTGT
jgi:hypothetical protein